MIHRQPTDLEVRERIEGIGTDITVNDVKNVPNFHDDFRYKCGFKFQLLAAGRISEIAGKYAPRGIDAYRVDFQIDTKMVDEEEIDIMEDAVMFVLKTAKRKGKLRACALPLDPKYEPWAKDLCEYFEDYGVKHPFKFHKDFDGSQTYAMNYAKHIFEGMEWPMIEYTKSTETDFPEDRVIANKVNDKNQEVWLVQVSEDGAKWFRKAKSGSFKTSEKVPSRWKHFTSHCLRKRRTITLKTFYKLNPFGLSAYGGWTEKSQVDNLPGAMKHYLEIDIQSSPDAFYILKDDLAEMYFSDLLKPFEKLMARDKKRLVIQKKMAFIDEIHEWPS